MLSQDVGRQLVGRIDDTAHFSVDLLGHGVGVVALLADLAPQENQFLLLAIDAQTHLRAHAILSNHRPGQAGHLLQVVAGPGGDLTEDYFFGHAASQSGGNDGLELGAGHEAGIFVQVPRDAAGHAARDDGHLA